MEQLRLNSNCRFLGGEFCTTDERLLRLNEFVKDGPLTCHQAAGLRHPWISDVRAYRSRFIDIFGNDPVWRDVDFYLCGEPVYFCHLLSYFGKFVVGYISIPLGSYVPVSERALWYQQFYDMVADPRHVMVVSGPIFGEQITYATGVALPIVPPACLYTDAVYFPKLGRDVLMVKHVSTFWDLRCVLNKFSGQAHEQGLSAASLPVRFFDVADLGEAGRESYIPFAEHIASVIYPYSVSQFMFYEIYAMNMPIFMPTPEEILLLIRQCYSLCPDFDGLRPGHEPSATYPYSPFETSWAGMTYWTGFTDYVRFPHIQYFRSVPDLLMKLTMLFVA